MADIIIPSQVVHRTYRIASPDEILIIRNGQVIDSMTPEAAIENAQALIGQARKAISMQPKVAQKTAEDEAVLIRAGAPFSLTTNSKIRDEAKKIAETDRELRRAIPSIDPPKVAFGVPSVANVDDKKHKP